MVHLVYRLHENSSDISLVSVLDVDIRPASLCPSNHILITLTRVGENNCPEMEVKQNDFLGQFRMR